MSNANVQHQHLDINSAHTSKVGFDAAVTILQHWGCKTEAITNILRVNRSSYFAYKSGKKAFVLDKDQLTRISYILNIHAALRQFFTNSENIYGYMNMVNNNPYFEGRKPLEIIAAGDFGALHEVYHRVDHLRSGGWS